MIKIYDKLNMICIKEDELKINIRIDKDITIISLNNMVISNSIKYSSLSFDIQDKLPYLVYQFLISKCNNKISNINILDKNLLKYIININYSENNTATN